MIRVELSTRFAVSRAVAFGYITTPTNWPRFFPGFMAFEDVARARWQEAGDRIVFYARVLGMKRRMQMVLHELVTHERVRFVLQQQALPEIWHERIFVPTELGSQCLFVGSYEPRAGTIGRVDRWLVERLLGRGFAAAAAHLQRLLAAQPK